MLDRPTATEIRLAEIEAAAGRWHELDGNEQFEAAVSLIGGDIPWLLATIRRLAALEPLVRELEWCVIAESADQDGCPMCDGARAHGHYAGCRLTLALGVVDGEAPHV